MKGKGIMQKKRYPCPTERGIETHKLCLAMTWPWPEVCSEEGSGIITRPGHAEYDPSSYHMDVSWLIFLKDEACVYAPEAEGV